MMNEASLGFSCCGHCVCAVAGGVPGGFTLISLLPELQHCGEMTTTFIISLFICIDRTGLQYKKNKSIVSVQGRVYVCWGGGTCLKHYGCIEILFFQAWTISMLWHLISFEPAGRSIFHCADENLCLLHPATSGQDVFTAEGSIHKKMTTSPGSTDSVFFVTVQNCMCARCTKELLAY